MQTLVVKEGETFKVLIPDLRREINIVFRNGAVYPTVELMLDYLSFTTSPAVTIEPDDPPTIEDIMDLLGLPRKEYEGAT